MRAHRLHEAREVLVVGALQIDSRELPVGGAERVHGRAPAPGDVGGDAARHVGGDDRPLVRLGELHERAVVGRVARPGARPLQKVRLGNRSADVGVHRLLHVALEHLERQRDRHMTPREPLEDPALEPMRIRVVVLFADEHDVGPRQVGRHHLEIGEALSLRVVDALGDVTRFVVVDHDRRV